MLVSLKNFLVTYWKRSLSGEYDNSNCVES